MSLKKKKKAKSKAKKKKLTCWEGYERVPGTKAGTKGSCRPIKSKKKKKNK